MTRKDYELIANALAQSRPPIGLPGTPRTWWSRTVMILATDLQDQNPNFDRTRFVEACLKVGSKEKGQSNATWSYSVTGEASGAGSC